MHSTATLPPSTKLNFFYLKNGRSKEVFMNTFTILCSKFDIMKHSPQQNCAVFPGWCNWQVCVKKRTRWGCFSLNIKIWADKKWHSIYFCHGFHGADLSPGSLFWFYLWSFGFFVVLIRSDKLLLFFSFQLEVVKLCTLCSLDFLNR